MERVMLGVSLKDRKTNEWVRNKTRVTDVVQRISGLKWDFAGHVARAVDGRWNSKLLHWRPWLGKRPRGRPQMRWTDDLKMSAGLMWVSEANNRTKWRSMREAYIQKWKLMGL